jgi:hypothetical protein
MKEKGTPLNKFEFRFDEQSKMLEILKEKSKLTEELSKLQAR